jgi:hypothetical protein
VEKITKKIIEAKKQGNYELVQKLQQEMDKLQNIAWGKLIRELEDVKDAEDFPNESKN